MNGKAVDTGLLLLRIGIGILFLVHGVPKLAGGPDVWVRLGGAMGVFGITFAPLFWGLMAALAEAVGGALLILGLCVRPAAFFLLVTMVVACAMLIDGGQGFSRAAHPLALAVVFLSLLVAGGGRYALGAGVAGLKEHWYR
jgi:putative oxidoreductase